MYDEFYNDKPEKISGEAKKGFVFMLPGVLMDDLNTYPEAIVYVENMIKIVMKNQVDYGSKKLRRELVRLLWLRANLKLDYFELLSKKIKVINPEGKEMIYKSKSAFARDHGYMLKTILEKTNNNSSHNGWKGWEI